MSALGVKRDIPPTHRNVRLTHGDIGLWHGKSLKRAGAGTARVARG
jgi:hypothetical protein